MSGIRFPGQNDLQQSICTSSHFKHLGGANLTLSDGDMDPYVHILLDGKKVGETETAEAGGNPVYNYEFETLLRSTGKRLTDHVIEFVVYDWDR